MSRGRCVAAVVAGIVAGVLATLALQRLRPAPVVVPTASTPSEATTVATSTWPADAPTPEQVLYAQPRRMQVALSRLAPERAGKVDLYLVTFAGDGDENVFGNEAEYAARLFAARFDAAGHTLVLENNPATVKTRPLATWSNLETALRGIHKRMNPDEDILAVYLTSHGTGDHYLYVGFDSLPLDWIGAADLARILAEQPFRWKVVIVNACYSGGFIPPLRGDGTLVMTAASADRTSFGCGTESNITWFGDALLAHALNHDTRFTTAFANARTRISAWEKRDNVTPSEPEIAIGERITAQLDRWRAGFTPGAPVPFQPVTRNP